MYHESQLCELAALHLATASAGLLTPATDRTCRRLSVADLVFGQRGNNGRLWLGRTGVATSDVCPKP